LKKRGRKKRDNESKNRIDSFLIDDQQHGKRGKKKGRGRTGSGIGQFRIAYCHELKGKKGGERKKRTEHGWLQGHALFLFNKEKKGKISREKRRWEKLRERRKKKD